MHRTSYHPDHLVGTMPVGFPMLLSVFVSAHRAVPQAPVRTTFSSGYRQQIVIVPLHGHQGVESPLPTLQGQESPVVGKHGVLHHHVLHRHIFGNHPQGIRGKHIDKLHIRPYNL